MENSQVGTIGELQVASYFTALGCNVFTPISGHTEFDMVIEHEHKLARISVKTTNVKRNNKYRVDLRQNRYNGKSNFDPKSCDFVAIYIMPENRIEILEASTITQKTQIAIT